MPYDTDHDIDDFGGVWELAGRLLPAVSTGPVRLPPPAPRAVRPRLDVLVAAVKLGLIWAAVLAAPVLPLAHWYLLPMSFTVGALTVLWGATFFMPIFFTIDVIVNRREWPLLRRGEAVEAELVKAVRKSRGGKGINHCVVSYEHKGERREAVSCSLVFLDARKLLPGQKLLIFFDPADPKIVLLADSSFLKTAD